MDLTITANAAWRVIVATIILLVAVLLVALGLALPGIVVYNIAAYFAVLVIVAAGLVLVALAKRPIAGVGAIVAAGSALLAVYWRPLPASVIWTLGLIVGVGLIAYGTRQDSLRPRAWPLLLARFAVGWAFFDNGQNDLVWLTGTNGFLTSATNDVKRGPLFFLDGPYLDFLKGTVIPGAGTWTGLFLGAEFLFGLLVMVGLFTAVAQLGTLWLSANIMLQKSFVSHGAYSDKSYFLVGAFNLIAGAGLSHSIDASLRRHVPTWVAQYLMADPQATATEGAARRLDRGLSGAPVA